MACVDILYAGIGRPCIWPLLLKVRMVNLKWGTAMVYNCRESDSFIVSEKPSNKIRDNKRMAEEVEKRRLAEGNLAEQNKGRTQKKGSSPLLAFIFNHTSMHSCQDHYE